MESRRFIPTDVGKVVNRFLTEYFSQYVDYEFTARMEDSLDAISRGESEWIPLLKEFWKPFHDLIEHTETSVTREQASQARSLGADPMPISSICTPSSAMVASLVNRNLNLNAVVLTLAGISNS